MKKILMVILCAVLLVVSYTTARNAIDAKADSTLITCYALCKPGDYVNLRQWPSKKATIDGYLECGDSFQTDGHSKNGFIRVYGVGENSEEWIYCGFVSTEKPEPVFERYVVVAKNRVACRRWMDGPNVASTPWLINGSNVTVFYKTESWAVTNRGYIQTKWIEPDPE